MLFPQIYLLNMHVSFLLPPPSFFSSFFLILFKFGDFVPIITFSLPPPLTHPLNKQGYSFIITSWKHSLLVRMAMHSYPQCLNCLPPIGILPLTNASTSVLFSSVTRRLKEFLQDLSFIHFSKTNCSMLPGFCDSLFILCLDFAYLSPFGVDSFILVFSYLLSPNL